MTAILEGAGQRLGLASSLSVRERIAYWAVAAALLLHIAIAIICIVDWAALLNLALANAEAPAPCTACVSITRPASTAQQ